MRTPVILVQESSAATMQARVTVMTAPAMGMMLKSPMRKPSRTK